MIILMSTLISILVHWPFVVSPLFGSERLVSWKSPGEVDRRSGSAAGDALWLDLRRWAMCFLEVFLGSTGKDEQEDKYVCQCQQED